MNQKLVVSQAIRFALQVLKNINKELLEKPIQSEDYLSQLNGLLYALDIRQGDYKISGLEKDGLVIEYLKSKKDETFFKIKEIDFKVLKFEKEIEAKKFLELLEHAIGKERYRIEVKDFGKEMEEKLQKKSGKEYGVEEECALPEEIIGFYEIIPPIFKIYLKERNTLLGELNPFGNFFVIKFPIHPEAIYVMKKIGERIFECKDGKLQVNLNNSKFGGIKNLEEWLVELKKWKEEKSLNF